MMEALMLIESMPMNNRRRISAAVVLSTALLFSNQAFSFERDVHIWIKSFIPSKAASKNESLSVTESGETVLPVPPIPIPMTLHVSMSSCFSTDDRGFSNDPTASARTTTEFVLKIRDRTMTVDKAEGRRIDRYGKTRNVNCMTGRVLSQTLKPDKKNVLSARKTQTIGEIKENGFDRVLFVKASVHDPFYVNAPALDFSLVFTYSVRKRELSIVGTRGTFPAFEAYARVDGVTHTLFQYMPDKGISGYSLIDLNLGINTENVSYGGIIMGLR